MKIWNWKWRQKVKILPKLGAVNIQLTLTYCRYCTTDWFIISVLGSRMGPYACIKKEDSHMTEFKPTAKWDCWPENFKLVIMLLLKKVNSLIFSGSLTDTLLYIHHHRGNGPTAYTLLNLQLKHDEKKQNNHLDHLNTEQITKLHHNQSAQKCRPTPTRPI